MLVNEADIIFPPRVIPELRDLRGIEWQKWIDRASGYSPDSQDRAALVLMMVKLAGCVTCQADSFKAMRGCALCAAQTIKRFRGEDNELFHLIEAAKQEILDFQRKR